MKSFAARIKFIRNSLNLNRKDFGKIIGFSDDTIRSWEQRNVTPYKNTIQKIIQNCIKHNVESVSFDWLTEGEGPSPFLRDININYSEKDIFLIKNPNAITFAITNDNYAPYFQDGDVVGGIPQIQQKNLSIVLLAHKNGGLDIRKTYLCEDSTIVLVPLTIYSKLSIIFDSNNMTLYKIVYFLRTTDLIGENPRETMQLAS